MGTTGQSITLANSIIGVGILAMPFCFQQCGVLLAALILVSMGLVSRLCCYFLLKSALITRRRNFEFLAFHVFGPAGKLAVEVGIIGFLMGTCIAYFVVVGDLGPQIIAKMFNINQSDILRTSIMLIVSLACVLPLGLLRNVDSLSNVSAATIAFYFCLVIKVIAEAAVVAWAGDGVGARLHMWKPQGLLQCVPIFSMALFCQTQLFEIFESLPTLSLEKMNIVTRTAINICTAVYFTLGLFGYVAFSEKNISGNILISLSPTLVSDVIKLGFVMSLAFSFPLIIFPCRASIYSFLFKKAQKSHHDHNIMHSIPETTFRCITIAIIAVALFISLLLPNIELVLGLLGSTIGVMICVVFPAACFVNVTFKDTNERVLAKGIVILGLIIMVLGTYANLQAAESQLDRYDEKFFTQERIDKIVEDFFESKKIEKVNIKPLDVKEAAIENLNMRNEVKKDSEVQPPNPVPPDSQSDEKKKPVNEKRLEKLSDIPKLQEETLKSHPRNVKGKLNEPKLADTSNNESQQQNIDNNNSAEKLKESANLEGKIKTPSNEEKNNIMKQQKLIETIKQHGQEQKELIKEQKEILDEIIKTKKELQQNKKDLESSEAKKLAVESIQKIADIAIKSLSGVSEKPVQVNDKVEPLEKAANDAVQEIAKKAVEAIGEIQERKESKEKNVQKKDQVPSGNNNHHISNKVNNQQASISNGQNISKVDLTNVQNLKDINIPIPVVAQNINSETIRNENNLASIVQPSIDGIQSNNKQPIVQNSIIESQDLNNPLTIDVNPNIVNANSAQIRVGNQDSNLPPSGNSQLLANQNFIKNENIVHQNNIPLTNSAPNNLNKVQSVINTNKVQSSPQSSMLLNKENVASQNSVKNEHKHSLDEPQSYKEGEESQKKKDSDASVLNKILQNEPLPIAKIESSSYQLIKDKIKTINQLQQNSNNINDGNQNVNILEKENVKSFHTNPKVVQDNLENVRQKREAVDCAEKTLSLRPENIEICKTSNIVLENNQKILTYGDLNELALPKSLPLDGNLVHHISRSLKTYKETR